MHKLHKSDHIVIILKKQKKYKHLAHLTLAQQIHTIGSKFTCPGS